MHNAIAAVADSLAPTGYDLLAGAIKRAGRGPVVLSRAKAERVLADLDIARAWRDDADTEGPF